MIAPPVLLQSAFCALKKTDWLKLDRFKFLILDILKAWRVSAELQLESQSEPTGPSGIYRNIFDSDRLWERVGPTPLATNVCERIFFHYCLTTV